MKKLDPRREILDEAKNRLKEGDVDGFIEIFEDTSYSYSDMNEVLQGDKGFYDENERIQLKAAFDIKDSKHANRLLDQLDREFEEIDVKFMNYHKHISQYFDSEKIESVIPPSIREQAVKCIQLLLEFLMKMNLNLSSREDLIEEYNKKIVKLIYKSPSSAKAKIEILKKWTGKISKGLVLEYFNYYIYIYNNREDLENIVGKSDLTSEEEEIRNRAKELIPKKENEHFFPKGYTAKYLLSDEFLNGFDKFVLEEQELFSLMFLNEFAAIHLVTMKENRGLNGRFLSITRSQDFKYIPSPKDLYDDFGIELLDATILQWRTLSEDELGNAIITIDEKLGVMNELLPGIY